MVGAKVKEFGELMEKQRIGHGTDQKKRVKLKSVQLAQKRSGDAYRLRRELRGSTCLRSSQWTGREKRVQSGKRKAGKR